MSKELSVHVVFGSNTGIIACKRSEFLSKVSERFHIEENEIEIYDKTSSKRIDVASFSSVMKVVIKRKNSSSSCNGASTSREESNHSEMVKKLRDNTVLTGHERAYLVDLLSNNMSLNIQKSNGDAKQVKNVKIQVNCNSLIPVRSIECQTDAIVSQAPNKRNLEAYDVMYQSKRLASSEKIDPLKAKELMDKLYDERRAFILVQLPLASFVKEKYPLLFSIAEVRNEIDRILHHGKCEQFLKNIEKYAKHVLGLVREDDPLLITTKRKIATFPTKIQKKYALQVGSLLMISSLMHENRGFLKLTDQPHESSILPYIQADAKLDDIFSNDHSFEVYVENIRVCTARDFPEAVLCLMGCYFIFSVEYPNHNWDTFITFERLYLEISETEGANKNVRQIIKTLHLLVSHKKDLSYKNPLIL